MKERIGGDTAGELARENREWANEGIGIIDSWDTLEQFPWDEVTVDYKIYDLLEEYVPSGMKVMVASSLFEHVLENLFGYEGLFYLIADGPAPVKEVFDRWGEKVMQYYRNVIDLDQVGGIFHADDLAHEHGKPYFYHCCGNVYTNNIMDDLIEDIGIDGSHSFQENILPITEAKKQYGERVALLGGVDVDNLVRMTPEEVRSYTADCFDNPCPRLYTSLMETLNIGLIGYGGIGKVHTLGYKQLPLYYPGVLPRIVLKGVCTSRGDTAQIAAENGGFEDWYTDINELVYKANIDVIDCSVPNFVHKEIIIAAAQAGKHIYCEKPLAVNLQEAEEIAEAVGKSGTLLGMTFHYRFSPAMLRAKQLIDEGALGEVYHFRAAYLHTGYQHPERPMSWRLRKKTAGGGALMDLGAHVIDLVQHLFGGFSSVRALCKTYIQERPVAKGTKETEKVDVDDAAWVEAKLTSGAVGTIEVSRFATGTLDDLFIEVYGEKGAFRFSLMDPHFLDWFDASKKGGEYGGEQGWTKLATVQHYPGAVVPPGRAIMGWPRLHAENQFQFLRSILEGKQPRPGIEDGLQVQRAIEAAYRSAEDGEWVTLR